jgi:hypothetical protein
MYQNMFRHLCTTWNSYTGLKKEVYETYKTAFELCPCPDKGCNRTRFTNFIRMLQKKHTSYKEPTFTSHMGDNESNIFWNHWTMSLEDVEEEDKTETTSSIPSEKPEKRYINLYHPKIKDDSAFEWPKKESTSEPEWRVPRTNSLPIWETIQKGIGILWPIQGTVYVVDCEKRVYPYDPIKRGYNKQVGVYHPEEDRLEKYE